MFNVVCPDPSMAPFPDAYGEISHASVSIAFQKDGVVDLSGEGDEMGRPIFLRSSEQRLPEVGVLSFIKANPRAF